MILKSYLFSRISDNWQQYTTDHTEELFKLMCESCTSQNQIAVRREGNLMCYVYIRKHKDTYIGLSIVCGEICNDLLWMRDSFQEFLEQSAHKGVLFCYDAEGNIIPAANPFASEAAETDSLFRAMKQRFGKAKSKWEALPAEDFSIPKESKIQLAFDEDSKKKITDALRHYHNVLVTMENTIPSSYTQTVQKLSNSIKRLISENTALDKQVAKISGKKKRSTIVAVLAFLLIVCVVVAYVMGNVKTYEKQLEKLTTVMPLVIDDIEIANVSYRDTIETDYGHRIYSSNTMCLKPKIYYTGIRRSKITLRVKWFRPNGVLSTGTSSSKWFSQEKSVSVIPGSNNVWVLSPWGNKNKGHWGRGEHRIEIWYNDMCLKSKTFTIY